MRIYFGKVEDENLVAEGCFEQDGVPYEFVLELSTEEAVIYDSCNRIMPISVKEHWAEFVNAVVIADSYMGPVVRSMDKMERINSDEVRTA